MATGPSGALCVSSVCGRGPESRVCALDRVRGSSFVMRLQESELAPSSHTGTYKHTHLQSRLLFMWGWTGIPLPSTLPKPPYPAPSYISLFCVFNHFLTHEPQTHSSHLHPPLPFFFFLILKEEKRNKNSQTLLEYRSLLRKVRELTLAIFALIFGSSQFRELTSVIYLLWKRKLKV